MPDSNGGVVQDFNRSSFQTKALWILLLTSSGISVPTALSSMIKTDPAVSEVDAKLEAHIKETRSLLSNQISIMDTLVIGVDSLIAGNRRSFTMEMQRACEDYRGSQWFESTGDDGVRFCNNMGSRARGEILRGAYGRGR